MYSKNKSSRNFREILVHLPEDTMTKVEVILFDLQEELSGKEVGKELRALALFINLITLICRCGNDKNSAIDLVENPNQYNISLAVKYAKLHFNERPKIDVLGQIAYMSKRDFYREFEASTGVSPKRFILLKALEESEHLLRTSLHSIQEISYECGFCDSNHFSKVFKEFYNISPGQYRNNLKKSSVKL
jgi:AraC-like DNA-binding protein